MAIKKQNQNEIEQLINFANDKNKVNIFLKTTKTPTIPPTNPNIQKILQQRKNKQKQIKKQKSTQTITKQEKQQLLKKAKENNYQSPLK